MLSKISLIAALFWTVIIIFVCLIKASQLPKVEISNIDKYIHVFLYFVFSVLWFFALRFSLIKNNWEKLLVVVFLMSLFFGITIEVFQTLFTKDRNGDFKDVIANIVGAFLAILFLSLFKNFDFFIKK